MVEASSLQPYLVQTRCLHYNKVTFYRSVFDVVPNSYFISKSYVIPKSNIISKSYIIPAKAGIQRHFWLGQLLPRVEGKTAKRKNPSPWTNLARSFWNIARPGGWKTAP